MENKELRIALHDGQLRAAKSRARFVGVLAGTQSGKTSYTPLWLLEEMTRRGPGDYLYCAPTFQLLEKKALPEMRRVFERMLKLGRYQARPVRQFIFSEDGARRAFGSAYNARRDDLPRILFGHANDAESLESATVKAAVLDEAGQKRFKAGAWEAILRRLSLSQGRALITTSLYSVNWLKDKYDAWQRGDADWEFVNFPSIANPFFPLDEYERARRDLPHWRFRMQYEGLFDRPAGLVYDVVDPARHFIPRVALPSHWQRIAGIDFGEVNTAAVVLAVDRAGGRLYVEHEYKPGRQSVREHAANLRRLNVVRAFGGAPGEEEWREDFRRAGLPVGKPPVTDRDVQILRTYAEFKNDRLFIFDDCHKLKDDLQSLAYKLDDRNDPTDRIEDENMYHLAAALRYGVASLVDSRPPAGVGILAPNARARTRF